MWRIMKKKGMLIICIGGTLAASITVMLSSSPQSELTFTLMVRTASQPDLLYQFYCLFLRTAVFFWPAKIGNFVVILDHESAIDRRFGYKLISQVKQHYPEFNLTVFYERQPLNEKIWKFHTTRSEGYNRQLYSTFISDLYTANDVIVYMDADVQFRIPITLKYLVNTGKLRVFGNSPLSAPWMDMWVKTTEEALGRKMVANFMITFPQSMYRDTITNCREYLLKRFNATTIGTAMGKFYGPDKLLSPINIIMNYAWYFERHRYDWHLAIENVDETNTKLMPDDQIRPSDTLPTIIAVPHSINKKWDKSQMLPGYCETMSVTRNYSSTGCKGVHHNYKLLCHYNFEHHRFAWPGADRWCTLGKLEPCCKQAAHAHYRDVVQMFNAGFYTFNKSRPEFVNQLAKEVGVKCKSLSLP